MSRPKIIIHNHLPRRAKDAWTKGSSFPVRSKPGEKLHEHAVSREQEEKNRDEAYRRTGITRIQQDVEQAKQRDSNPGYPKPLTESIV